MAAAPNRIVRSSLPMCILGTPAGCRHLRVGFARLCVQVQPFSIGRDRTKAEEIAVHSTSNDNRTNSRDDSRRYCCEFRHRKRVVCLCLSAVLVRCGGESRRWLIPAGRQRCRKYRLYCGSVAPVAIGIPAPCPYGVSIRVFRRSWHRRSPEIYSQANCRHLEVVWAGARRKNG